MPVNSCRKGKAAEREAAAYLRGLGFADAKRGQQHKGGDDSPDVACPALAAIHFEIKVGSPAYIGLGTTLDAAYEQARFDSWEPYPVVRNNGTGKVPVVLWRNTRRPWRLSWVADGVLVTTTGDERIKATLLRLSGVER